jgi:acetyltransferase-like isoleucine patch superfamily enzyme
MKFVLSRVKKTFFYFFGLFIGKFAYPTYVFEGRHFQRPGSIGWEWLFHCFVWQKIIGINKHVPWPVSFRISIAFASNIEFHPDDLNNFMTHGSYFQAGNARLVIGKGTYIAPNVGIITENHDLKNPDKRAGGKDIIIGEKCWLGFHSIVLPGVVLGNHTVVGAGSVVTKSFPNGYCVIAGNPAKKIRDL